MKDRQADIRGRGGATVVLKRAEFALTVLIATCLLLAALVGCEAAVGAAPSKSGGQGQADTTEAAASKNYAEPTELMEQSGKSSESGIDAGGVDSTGARAYTDANGDVAYVPKGFDVSEKEGERTISTGLVVVGTDGSEYVWVPTTQTALAARDFGSYFSGGDGFSRYYDDTSLEAYRAMVASVEKYGGFYIGRYEASKGADGLPASKRVSADEPGSIWVQFSPQDTASACERLYAGNDTVQGFLCWGANWDTVLQWLVDSGCKTWTDVALDSTSWGNYSDDGFSQGARGDTTGAYEQAKANNIYDLAGNNWEWTQERCGSDYVMRGGGYNLMGGACPGSRYPAALRDPLPGNDHHPNVTFRVGLFVK